MRLSPVTNADHAVALRPYEREIQTFIASLQEDAYNRGPRIELCARPSVEFIEDGDLNDGAVVVHSFASRECEYGGETADDAAQARRRTAAAHLLGQLLKQWRGQVVIYWRPPPTGR